MTRRYSLVIEGDEMGFSACVPELPSILVTGRTMDELTARATEAIQTWWQAAHEGSPPSAVAREIEVPHQTA